MHHNAREIFKSFQSCLLCVCVSEINEIHFNGLQMEYSYLLKFIFHMKFHHSLLFYQLFGIVRFHLKQPKKEKKLRIFQWIKIVISFFVDGYNGYDDDDDDDDVINIKLCEKVNKTEQVIERARESILAIFIIRINIFF